MSPPLKKQAYSLHEFVAREHLRKCMKAEPQCLGRTAALCVAALDDISAFLVEDKDLSYETFRCEISPPALAAVSFLFLVCLVHCLLHSCVPVHNK